MRHAAVLLALSCWLALPLPAQADDAAATPTPPPQSSPGPSFSFPSAADIAGALVGPLVDGLSTFVLTLPGKVALWIQTWLDSLIDYLWSWFGEAVSRFNLITNLPPGLTYNLPAVQSLRARMTTLAFTMWGLAAVCQVAYGAGGTMFGRSWTELFPGLGRLLLVGAAIKLAPAVMAGMIDFANALAAAFLAPGAMLPGSGNGQISGIDAGVAEVTAAVLFLVPGLLFLFSRIGLVVWVDLLLVVTPLMLVLWAMPFSLANRAGAFWANQFLVSVAIQVPLALVLALADGLVGAAGAMGGANDPAQRLMTGLLYCGLLWTALRLPARLGALAHGAEPVRTVQTVVKTAATRAAKAAAAL